ncbi:hypothetical protein V6N11_051665 [Hibiscus sabdariffa]|uniref:Uncharacterized protein n=1 Tax=Hibiscus sabdariffa TaxID=183260 RepID=A0ABR2U8G9_9ROSI
MQRQIALLHDAPNGVVSIRGVRLLPRIAGRDGVGCHACSIARLTTVLMDHPYLLHKFASLGRLLWAIAGYCGAKDIPHDPMVHTDTSNVVEEAVEDVSLDPENSETAADRLASEDVPYDPMANSDDLVHDAITEVADLIIRDVAALILGVSVASDATVTLRYLNQL